tara:strand:- start:50 stop:1042 length:993 start_codon:yes stop_codon:yes gene_type:complete
MIVSRSPYRISFFGGGTDYEDWFSINGGAFLSMAINYYTYITLRIKPEYQPKQFRVLWRLAEEVESVDLIKHPIVKHTLKFFNYDKGLDISYIGDLPGGSGMGSSSAFTAALVKAIYVDMKKDINSYELARISYNIEKNKLKETVGIQDQIATSFGGFNSVNISKNGSYDISPINLSTSSLKNFTERLILVYTGQTRRATEIAQSKVKNIINKKNEFKSLQDMVPESKNYLINDDIEKFGSLMHEAWKIKRSLSPVITNNNINDLYEYGINNGAIGGKILGAGGGGFLLFVSKEGQKDSLIEKLKSHGRSIVPFNMSKTGTKIIYNEEPR